MNPPQTPILTERGKGRGKRIYEKYKNLEGKAINPPKQSPPPYNVGGWGMEGNGEPRKGKKRMIPNTMIFIRKGYKLCYKDFYKKRNHEYGNFSEKRKIKGGIGSNRKVLCYGE